MLLSSLRSMAVRNGHLLQTLYMVEMESSVVKGELYVYAY